MSEDLSPQINKQPSSAESPQLGGAKRKRSKMQVGFGLHGIEWARIVGIVAVTHIPAEVLIAEPSPVLPSEPIRLEPIALTWTASLSEDEFNRLCWALGVDPSSAVDQD